MDDVAILRFLGSVIGTAVSLSSIHVAYYLHDGLVLWASAASLNAGFFLPLFPLLAPVVEHHAEEHAQCMRVLARYHRVVSDLPTVERILLRVLIIGSDIGHCLAVLRLFLASRPQETAQMCQRELLPRLLTPAPADGRSLGLQAEVLGVVLRILLACGRGAAAKQIAQRILLEFRDHAQEDDLRLCGASI